MLVLLVDAILGGDPVPNNIGVVALFVVAMLAVAVMGVVVGAMAVSDARATVSEGPSTARKTPSAMAIALLVAVLASDGRATAWARSWLLAR